MKKGRIGHDYSFHYFGSDMYQGKVIGGASVDLLFQCYDEHGKEVLFTEKDSLSSVLDVRFDKKKAYVITVNRDAMGKLCRKYGLRKVCFTVHRHVLYYWSGCLSDDLQKPDGTMNQNVSDIMNELGNLPIQFPMEVDEAVFRKFLFEHAEDFAIKDNRHAQSCSVFIVEKPK